MVPVTLLYSKVTPPTTRAPAFTSALTWSCESSKLVGPLTSELIVMPERDGTVTGQSPSEPVRSVPVHDVSPPGGVTDHGPQPTLESDEGVLEVSRCCPVVSVFCGLPVLELAKNNGWFGSSNPMLYESRLEFSPRSKSDPGSEENKSKSPSATGKGKERAIEMIVRKTKKSRISKQDPNVVSRSVAI